MMGWIGKNSNICIHGDEDGKCSECYDDFVQRGIRHEPVGTYGQVKERDKVPAPKPLTITEEVAKNINQYRQRLFD